MVIEIMPTTETNETQDHALPAAKPQKLLPASTGPVKSNRGGLWRRIILILVILAIVVFFFFRLRDNKKEAAETSRRPSSRPTSPSP